MPAAAKIEKSVAASGELTNGKGKIASSSTNTITSTTNGNGTTNNSQSLVQDPQKIVNTIIEKKVRNLEKRKVRLLEIKALEDKGQQLEAEQKAAVRKLDSVVEMIDLLKDVGKNVTDGLTDYSKQLKKQQKRDALEKQTERQQQDAERVKLWLNAQLILARFNLAKNDLLQGENGAVKLEESQVEAMEKLVELLAPQSFEVIESSVEKVNFLLEGNKREFTTGVSYSVLKETLLKLIESRYFEKIALPTTTNITSVESSDDNKEEESSVLTVEETETVSPTEQVQPLSHDKPEHSVEQKQAVQQQNNPTVHLNQLCFMRDPVVENELQHKDPAVVAVASAGFPYQPQLGQGLPASSGSNILPSNTISNHYSHTMYPAVSMGTIPTQTFTNPSYTALIPGANQYIPVTMPGQIPHQMQISEQTLPMRNVGPAVSSIPANEKTLEQATGDKQQQQQQFSTNGGSPKDASNLHTSQDGGEGKPINGQFVNSESGASNGHYKRNNRSGPRSGNPRGNYGGGNPNGGSFRGRGGKPSYGGGNPTYFNGGNNNGTAPNGNFNAANQRPTNRQNGGGGPGGNRSGPYRQAGGAPRNNPNNFNNNQAAPVPAK